MAVDHQEVVNAISFPMAISVLRKPAFEQIKEFKRAAACFLVPNPLHHFELKSSLFRRN
jgi:hypothetical protein